MGSLQILESTATFDATSTHRLSLFRRWGPGPLILAVGLNPSSADATKDDHTVRRLISLLDAQGFRALVLLNLWTRISASPRVAIGTEGQWTESDWRRFDQWYSRSDARLWMWGALGWGHPDRQAIHATDANAFCFGITRNGMPKHPLYLAANTPLVRFAEMTGL